MVTTHCEVLSAQLALQLYLENFADKLEALSPNSAVFSDYATDVDGESNVECILNYHEDLFCTVDASAVLHIAPHNIAFPTDEFDQIHRNSNFNRPFYDADPSYNPFSNNIVVRDIEYTAQAVLGGIVIESPGTVGAFCRFAVSYRTIGDKDWKLSGIVQIPGFQPALADTVQWYTNTAEWTVVTPRITRLICWY